MLDISKSESVNGRAHGRREREVKSCLDHYQHAVPNTQHQLIMSKRYQFNGNEFNEFTNNELDDKYIYCPKYDLFLSNIKPELIKRLTQHLKDRQTKFIICADKIKPYIETFISIVFNATTHYRVNKMNDIIPYINTFISEWKGPIISKDYKKKFNDPKTRKTIKVNKLFLNVEKFNHNSINWCDQSSGKIEGNFFAMHIEEIKIYIRTCCRQINGILDAQRECIEDCIWCYIRHELLITTIQFTRTNQKPLIRNKTLKANVQLHTSLDIIQFVEEFKLIEKQLKENKNKNENGNKTKRIKISQIFVKRLVKYCKELLNEAEAKLHTAFAINTPVISPHSDSNNSVEFNECKDNYNSSNDNISMTSSESKWDSYEYEQNYLYHNNYNIINGYNNMVYNNNNHNNYMAEPMYYGHQRGGYYSSINRWNPYNIPPNTNFVPVTHTYYNLPNTMVTYDRNYDNSNGLINNVFNDENTNYYGNYNVNESIIGDGIQEVNLYGLPELTEQINRDMAVDAINNIR